MDMNRREEKERRNTHKHEEKNRVEESKRNYNKEEVEKKYERNLQYYGGIKRIEMYRRLVNQSLTREEKNGN